MRKFLCILSILFCAPAWAGVVYNWHTIDTAGSNTTFTGQIELTDEAWRAKSTAHTHAASCPPESCFPADFSDQSSPVLRFAFDGDRAASPFVGEGSIALDYQSGTGWEQSPPWWGIYSLALDAVLQGSIDVSSGDVSMRMASTGAVWTVLDYGSDMDNICDAPGARCAGVTGIWVLDLSTIPRRVPEPATVALLALGFALAGAVRRRR
jgi:hypothetical protein